MYEIHFDAASEARYVIGFADAGALALALENSWMRGPTEVDWFYRYDPCVAELTRQN